METRYIKEFLTLCQCMSYSEAANQLYISQSSLSKHIQTMEHELGVPLFLRTTRSIQLTRAGELYLKYARQIAELDAQATLEMEELIRKESQTLTIGVIQNPQYYGLAKYISDFREENPDIRINMRESDEAGLLDMFHRKHINIFSGFLPSDSTGTYNYTPMIRTRFVAICPKGHPFEGRESISLQDMHNERLLLPAHNSTLSRIIRNAFKQAQVDVDIVYEGSSFGSIELIKAQMGISLHSVEFDNCITDRSEIFSLPIVPPVEFTYGICSRDDLSSAERKFHQFMTRFVQPEANEINA